MTGTALATRSPAEPQSLGSLAEDIRREHNLSIRAALDAIAHAVRAGEALLKARELVPRGTWERWLDENVPEVAVQARLYMRLANYREVIPAEATTLLDASKSLRGLPAFDGSGPVKHPPEVRDRARELIGQGLSRRLVASMLNIDKKCVDRWMKREPDKPREGNYRTGRPSRAEQKKRLRLIDSEQRGIGPAALANCFRAVWEAQRSKNLALVGALRNLADCATEWADQIDQRENR